MYGSRICIRILEESRGLQRWWGILSQRLRKDQKHLPGRNRRNLSANPQQLLLRELLPLKQTVGVPRSHGKPGLLCGFYFWINGINSQPWGKKRVIFPFLSKFHHYVPNTPFKNMFAFFTLTFIKFFLITPLLSKKSRNVQTHAQLNLSGQFRLLSFLNFRRCGIRKHCFLGTEF